MIIITLIHILVCVALVLIVLLQAGKGAEMGAAFGGASQTVFGSSGATGFLTKITYASAAIFMITSLLLAFVSSQRASSVMQQKPAAATETTEVPAKVPVQPQAPESAPSAPSTSK